MEQNRIEFRIGIIFNYFLYFYCVFWGKQYFQSESISTLFHDIIDALNVKVRCLKLFVFIKAQLTNILSLKVYENV